jgi:CheY-like chemotaxis protein
MSQMLKILIIDDDNATRSYVTKILPHQSYETLTASSGTEALKVLETHSDIDIILLDLMMPGLSGFKVLEMLKADPKLASIKVIIMSAMAEVEEKIKAFSAGAADYMIKPFGKGELVQTLNKVGEVKSESPELVVSKSRDLTLPGPRLVVGSATLDELMAGTGEEGISLLAELLQLFLTDSPALLAELETSLAQASAEGIQQAAHTLKSSAAILGAVALSDLCQELENLGRSKNLTLVPTKFSQLLAEYEVVKQVFQNELRRLEPESFQ